MTLHSYTFSELIRFFEGKGFVDTQMFCRRAGAYLLRAFNRVHQSLGSLSSGCERLGKTWFGLQIRSFFSAPKHKIFSVALALHNLDSEVKGRRGAGRQEKREAEGRVSATDGSARKSTHEQGEEQHQ
jgi:hypothetical protein